MYYSGFNPTPSNQGFVIRATDLHSSDDVHAFPNGFEDIELLSNMNMTLVDVKTFSAGTTPILLGLSLLPTEGEVKFGNCLFQEETCGTLIYASSKETNLHRTWIETALLSKRRRSHIRKLL